MATRKTSKKKSSTRAVQPRMPAARPRTELAKLLDATRLRTLQRRSFDDAELAELSPDSCGGRQTVIYRTAEHGLDISMAVDLHRHPIHGADPDGDRAMVLLGRLTRALRNYELSVDLMVDARGVAGLLLRRHVCAQPKAEQLEQMIEQIGRLASCIETDAMAPADEVELAPFPHLLTRAAQFTPAEDQREPYIMPTYDTMQLAELRERSDRLKG